MRPVGRASGPPPTGPPVARYTPAVSTTPLSAIIITDGGLPALVAAAIEAERAIAGGGGGVGNGGEVSGGAGSGGVVSLMPWPSHPMLAPVQAAAVTSLARFFRFDHTETPDLRLGGIEATTGLLETLSLLAGVEVARAVGCDRLIWPVQFHADESSLPAHLDRIAAAVDRALLVSRLGLLDGDDTVEEITIETPLVDLTDRQIADLAVDLDAPAYLCWWWRQQGEPEAERVASGERRAWLAALGAAGWVQTAPGVTVTPRTEPARNSD